MEPRRIQKFSHSLLLQLPRAPFHLVSNQNKIKGWEAKATLAGTRKHGKSATRRMKRLSAELPRQDASGRNRAEKAQEARMDSACAETRDPAGWAATRGERLDENARRQELQTCLSLKNSSTIREPHPPSQEATNTTRRPAGVKTITDGVAGRRFPASGGPVHFFPAPGFRCRRKDSVNTDFGRLVGLISYTRDSNSGKVPTDMNRIS